MESNNVKNNKCHCLPKTPCTKFNRSSMVCSSSKKSKIPPKLELSSAASNISCPHSNSFNISKLSHSIDKVDNLCPSTCISPYEDCDSLKHRKECLKYKQIHSQENQHSCCTHNTDILGHKCNNSSLNQERQKFGNNCNCNKKSSKEQQPSFSKNLESGKYLSENINLDAEDDKLACRYHTACHHSPRDPEVNCPESRKCCTPHEVSTCEHIMVNTDGECNGPCNHYSNQIDDEEPLIEVKQSNETPEVSSKMK